jgi:starch synthase
MTWSLWLLKWLRYQKRIQVYFIDNVFAESHFADEEGVMYPDNDEFISSQKGCWNGKEIELGSDIIHVHGWMAACAHIHEAFYKNEALFSETKIVTSVYSQSFDGTLMLRWLIK